MINGFEDAQKIGRENVDRGLQSFGALSRGWQQLATETAGYSKQAFEDGAAHLEKLFGTRSFEGAVEAQSEFVKSSYEKALGQATRFGELYLDLVREAAKPFEGLAAPRAR